MAIIIRIRKGINGFRYSVCDEKGQWFGNIEKLSDASKNWKEEIKAGNIVLVRELNLMPDMSLQNEIGKKTEVILKQFAGD